ncbi:MAG TPA: hypothetical protein VI818_00315 [Candidatus Thermoplasmatota archaeon]|nr:hypothetical protein [Candidatus Thermoplasmatota archaeon]
MRRTVKKWGNGLAVRLPRESPETGRLEAGMELDVSLKVIKKVSPNWRPLAVDFGDGRTDWSTRHDEYLAEHLDAHQ